MLHNFAHDEAMYAAMVCSGIKDVGQISWSAGLQALWQRIFLQNKALLQHIHGHRIILKLADRQYRLWLDRGVIH